MTWAPQRQRVPAGPNMGKTTLQIMGRTATQAADTVAFREWASRLAARARPRDYTDQLRQLYKGIIDRWRYVMESGEWVHGTPRSLIAHVLGTKYNAPDVEPTTANLDEISTKEKGWGDCDDVATAVAAGVIAMGMVPFFRVSGPPLHVSVVARTPTGDFVSVDPVGHPKHGFGWAAPSRSGQVHYFDMNGNQAQALPWPVPRPFAGVDTMQNAVEFYGGIDEQPAETFFSGFDGVPRSRVAYPHLAYVREEDLRGPRVLAVPMRTMRLLQRGRCPHGHCGVDEYGEEYEYDGARDIWAQRGSPAANTMVYEDQNEAMDDQQFAAAYGWNYADAQHVLSPEPYGAPGRRERRRRRRAKRRARRKARRARMRAGARRFFKRIGRGIRKVGQKVIAPILRSKWAQRVIGRALSVVGVPARLTKAFMAAAGSIVKKIGIGGLIRLIRKDRKKLLRILAAAGKEGLKAATRLSGIDDDDPRGTLLQTWTQQGNVEFPSQHILGFVGVPGIYGQADLEVEIDPTPGAWYRVQKGNTLLGVAAEAYGTSGGANLTRSKWINNAAANAVYVDSSLASKWYPEGRISFRPRFASDPGEAITGARGRSYPLIWIPMDEGDEPAAIVEPTPEPDYYEPALPEPPPEPTPEPISPIEPAPVPEPAPEPEPFPPEPTPEPPFPIEPAPPVAPIEPEPAPDEPDVPEPPDAEPPAWTVHAAACRRVGGQWVTPPHAEGPHEGGCVICEPGTIWSDAAGRCIPHLVPTPTPDLPDDIPTPTPTPPPVAPTPTPPTYPPPVAPTPTPTPPTYPPPVAPGAYPPPPAGPIPAAALLFLLMNA